MDDIEQAIIERAAQGDLSALEAIYKISSGFVFSVALRVVRHREDAEEVTQEVFITVYEKVKHFRFESSFKTWLYRVTANAAINYAKKHSKWRDRSVEVEDHTIAVHADAPENLKKQDHEQQIAQLLAVLNPDQRACVVLRNIEGLSYQEIADALGININTVRSRLKRSREAMLAKRNEVMSHEL